MGRECQMHEKPEEVLAFVGCSQLVTLRGPARPRIGEEMRQLSVMPGGAMVVKSGRIAAIGNRAGIEDMLPLGAKIVDCRGRVLAPGFVDAHTHPVFGGDRLNDFEMRCSGASYREIAEAGGGIRSTIKRTQETSSQDLAARGKKHVSWFLRNGTTTIEAKSGYGGSVEEELRLLKVLRGLANETPLRIVPTVLGPHAVPEGESARSYARKVASELIPVAAKEGLARYADAFMEPGYFDRRHVIRVMAAARKHGLGVRLHADQLTRSGGAALAARLGAATADHLENVDSAGIAALRAAGVQPVLLPGSVYALGLGRYAPAREMIEAGLAVVLATDFNPGSSPTPSMPMAMSLACTQMHMTPAEALCAATINAAWSVGLGTEVGSLEPGKAADFVVFDCSDWREIPCFFGVEHAKWVYIGGERVFERGT
jgi:imidazolonepropionase